MTSTVEQPAEPVPTPPRQRPKVDLPSARRLLAFVLLGAAVIIGTTVWLQMGANKLAPSNNAILVIAPYVDSGTWVFDDESVGLRKEPFVAGVPEMIDELVKEIPNAKSGFRLLFSAQPFPGHQKHLTWTRSDGTGNYYQLDDPPLEGWICPALFQYYSEPPKNIYVKAEAITR